MIGTCTTMFHEILLIKYQEPICVILLQSRDFMVVLWNEIYFFNLTRNTIIAISYCNYCIQRWLACTYSRTNFPFIPPTQYLAKIMILIFLHILHVIFYDSKNISYLLKHVHLLHWIRTFFFLYDCHANGHSSCKVPMFHKLSGTIIYVNE